MEAVMSFWSFRPYQSVGARAVAARQELRRLEKKGGKLSPVEIDGRKIAQTFWGQAWCENLESYMDYENRLPRGRSYVRGGAVIDLQIARGEVRAVVVGQSTYNIHIKIATLPAKRWAEVKTLCAGRIGSIIELLQGRLSAEVMKVVTDRQTGLFPAPGEIKLGCSCPDWAEMCKHVAAALYGVGARLDSKPELLFLLRGVDATELITQAPALTVPAAATARRIGTDRLAEVFGVDIDAPAPPAPTPAVSTPAKAPRTAAAAPKPATRRAKPAKSANRAGRKKRAAVRV
jgi:uncharacterized Zn finger protein